MDSETKQAFDMVLSELKEIRTEITGINAEISGMKTEITGIKTEITGMKTDIAEIKATMATKDQVASVMMALNSSNLDLTAKDEELERAIRQNSYDIVKLRAAQ